MIARCSGASNILGAPIASASWMRAIRLEPFTTPIEVRKADEALQESQWLIEKARALESSENWTGMSRRTYRQIQEARQALRRLENALSALDARLTGVCHVEWRPSSTAHPLQAHPLQGKATMFATSGAPFTSRGPVVPSEERARRSTRDRPVD
jgi:hypothetical protein